MSVHRCPLPCHGRRCAGCGSAKRSFCFLMMTARRRRGTLPERRSAGDSLGQESVRPIPEGERSGRDVPQVDSQVAEQSAAKAITGGHMMITLVAVVVGLIVLGIVSIAVMM